MNLKDIKISIYIKLIAVATIIFLFFTKTPVWGFISSALSPIILAFVIAYILDYVVRFFEKKVGLHRVISILFTFILFISVLTVLGLVVVPSIIDAVTSLINAISNVDFNFEQFMNIDFNNFYLNEIQKSLINAVTPMLEKLTNATGSAVLIIVSEIQKITSGLISFLIAFVISLYMLAEKKDLVARLKRLIYAYFSDSQVHWIMYTLSLSNRIFKDFVLGKLLDSFIIGVLSFGIFKFFNFEYALLIALIVGITNMIPYFGPFIGAIPAAIITFVAAPTDPVQVVWMLLLILIIQQLDGLVIGPFILGDSVGASAFWIILAVTVGGATFGIIGMFLGVPIFVLIKTLVEEDVQRKLISKGYDGLEERSMRRRKK